MGGAKMRKSFAVSIIALTALPLTACGDQEPGPLTYLQAAQELAKGPESFKAFVNGLDNKRIRWTGTVVEARKWEEDDYVPAAGILIDADGQPPADLFATIDLDDLPSMTPGRKVTFTARLTDSIDEKGKLLIKLTAEKFH